MEKIKNKKILPKKGDEIVLYGTCIEEDSSDLLQNRLELLSEGCHKRGLIVRASICNFKDPRDGNEFRLALLKEEYPRLWLLLFGAKEEDDGVLFIPPEIW